MPRQGDGSGDSGPIETGENLVHGASGDKTLQHAKNNVAPLPEGEKGEAIEGLSGSGGGSAGITGASPPKVEDSDKSKGS